MKKDTHKILRFKNKVVGAPQVEARMIINVYVPYLIHTDWDQQEQTNPTASRKQKSNQSHYLNKHGKTLKLIAEKLKNPYGRST